MQQLLPSMPLPPFGFFSRVQVRTDAESLQHTASDSMVCSLAALCCVGLEPSGLGWAGLCCAVLCCAVLCCAVLCCAVLCFALLYRTMHVVLVQCLCGACPAMLCYAMSALTHAMPVLSPVQLCSAVLCSHCPCLLLFSVSVTVYHCRNVELSCDLILVRAMSHIVHMCASCYVLALDLGLTHWKQTASALGFYGLPACFLFRSVGRNEGAAAMVCEWAKLQQNPKCVATKPQ